MSKNLMNRDVLISGASIAGPALAYWLNKYGFRVTIVEKSPVLREGGYRVDIRGVAVDVLARMGILQQVQENATVMKGSTLINSKGKKLVDMDPQLFGLRQPGDIEIMRGDLAGILYENTRNDTSYIFGDSITGIAEEGSGVKVTFQRAEPRTFDLVIGADGLHSNVRALAFGASPGSITDLGYYISIFTIPNFLGLDHWELGFPSAGRVINVFSTGKNREARALFIFASPPLSCHYTDTEQQKKHLAANFIDNGWEAPRLLEHLSTTPDFYFDSLSQVHLNHLSNGRVALVGDAGYCPSPASGQGTSLALTGAYVLAGELAMAGGDHRTALPNYENEMREFIAVNQELGRSVLKEMIAKSSFQAWFQANILRLMLHLPGKKKIVSGMLKKTMDKVTAASNAIRLKDYR